MVSTYIDKIESLKGLKKEFQKSYCISVKSADNCENRNPGGDIIKSALCRRELLLASVIWQDGESFWFTVASVFVVIAALLGSYLVIRQGRGRHEVVSEKKINGEALAINSRISSKIVPGFGDMRRNRFELSTQAKKKILKDLRFLMEQKKVYCQKGITLEKLARMQGTNRTYLSSVIRDEYGENFTSFINNYRIKEAVNLLSDPGNKSPIKAIAENLGYQSLSTFYSAFNKIVKTSPSNYRKLSRTVTIKKGSGSPRMSANLHV